jgi:hypothetical protein
MLYVHGTRKPFGFHSPEWAQALAARPDCRVVPMRTGHWVMLDQPEAFNVALLDWLAPGATSLSSSSLMRRRAHRRNPVAAEDRAASAPPVP